MKKMSDVKFLLSNKTKPEVAAAIKTKCNCSDVEELELLLHNLLSPANSIDDEEIIDWLLWIMGGGLSPEEFSSTVRLYDKATTCGLVWPTNFVAYRCRTCGISPFMSLCTECFHNGNHEGHDFIIFRSETGGACDCGEMNVIKESGCCSSHGPQGSKNHKKSVAKSRSGDATTTSIQQQPAPPELLCVSSKMMPFLFQSLIMSMREEWKIREECPSKKSPKLVIPCKHTLENNNESSSMLLKGHQFIKMLQGLSDMGEAMRQVMINCLISSHIYMGMPRPSEDGFKSFLEELVHWTMKYEFPEDLIRLLLSMRSEFVYKEEFTKAFILHYKVIAETILKSSDPEKLCKHVAAVSVQLFSIEILAIKMVDNMNLLPLLTSTLNEMINCAVVMSSERRTIDCDHEIMRNNYYWPIKSDLKELLSHQPVALKFFENDLLLNQWFHFLSNFQGMNLVQYRRKGMDHIEQETEMHIGAFTAELEISATPMWTLLSHLRDPNTACLTKRIIQHCLQNVMEWPGVNKGEVSFHIPLHRNLSMYIRQGIVHQGLALHELLPPKEHALLIARQVIRLQASFHQIFSRGIWSRNGTEILNQAESYVNSLCCNSMIDADLFLLQCLAEHLPRAQLLSLIYEEFGVYNALGVSFADNDDREWEGEDLDKILEGFLLFMATLTTSRINCGLSEEQLLTLEMSTLLCKGDKLHSELIELLPERCGSDSQLQNFEKVLSHIAEYQAPRKMSQGKYIPKPVVWESLYDPIHTLLRSTNKAEFQISMDRYQEFMKRSNSCASSMNLWPPFRIPSFENENAVLDPRQLLSAGSVLEVIFIILYKAVHLGNVPQFTVALTVYLLDIATSTRNFQHDDVEESKYGMFPAGSDFPSNLLRKVDLYKLKQLFNANVNVQISKQSIISLLLQLHSQFKENAASFVCQPLLGKIEGESRVGDGAFFVSNLLHKLASRFSPVAHELVFETSNRDTNYELAQEKERDTRRRKAKERRVQIMTELAMKRQQFMKMNEDLNSFSNNVTNQSAKLIEDLPKEPDFQCVICMERDGVKFENPYGLITYLMPSSILSHRKVMDGNGNELFRNTLQTFGEFWNEKQEKVLKNKFDEGSIRLSFPLHGGHGVNIQTCGHYLHAECFNSYMKSLKKSKTNQRETGVQLSHNQFSCPMCRQTGNSFLPIIVEPLRISTSQTVDCSNPDENELVRILKKRNNVVLSTKQKQLVDKFLLEDLQRVVAFTKTDNGDSNNCSSVTVCGAESLSFVLLNAFEMESLRCQSTFPELQQSYISPLYSLLRYSYKSLSAGHTRKISQIWEMITGKFSVKGKRDVPLLLKDVSVLFSHILLQLPFGTEKKYLGLITQKLVLLKLIQIITALCCQLELEDLNQIKNLIQLPASGLQYILFKILEALLKFSGSLRFEVNDGENLVPAVSSLLRNIPELESFLGSRMKPFVKKLVELSNLLCDSKRDDFVDNEGNRLMFNNLLDYKCVIANMPNVERSIISWIEDLQQYRNIAPPVAILHLLCWDEPKLVELPTDYDKIFQSYRKLKCSNCNTVPSEPAVCLICGTVVCLNSFCCLDKRSKISEVIQHSIDCGMGSAVFLCVLSSAVLVVMGKEACVWGSIFLDNFGEEDLDLRRGKPLFQCKERFQFLQKQWKNQSFHKYEFKWFPHDNML